MVNDASQLCLIVVKIWSMHINHLSLTNFRNYGRLELDLPQKATLLYGHNAQGKTNLLEAIYYLATTRSPHADQDSQLLNWDAAQLDDLVVVGRLVAHIAASQGDRQIEMRLIQERKNGLRNGATFRREVLVNRRKVRLMDLLGHLRVVLFVPQDVQIITGSPAKRRRYLDITLCQIDPLYCRALSDYNKVLEQRNALLRQLAEGGGNRELLAVFDEKLVHLGSQIFTKRASFLTVMARETQRIYYEELTNGKETVRLSYLPRLQVESPGRAGDVSDLVDLGKWIEANPEAVSKRFAAITAEAYTTDVGRGSTNVGPHRDDWRFWINGRDLSSYGSRGQQRSAILALKMAEIIWMTKMTGESPILLLDEVVAELDEQRRALLLHYVQQSSQAILTATDPGMFTADFMRNSTSMRVSNGRIEREP
jgi:DNA replication and repair protein RecF